MRSNITESLLISDHPHVYAILNVVFCLCIGTKVRASLYMKKQQNLGDKIHMHVMANCKFCTENPLTMPHINTFYHLYTECTDCGTEYV